MARNTKKSTTAPGHKTRSVRPARRKLTEVERVRRFLLDSGFRKMTAEEMRRSPVVAALESWALPTAKPMTLEEIKKALEALGPTERKEVLAFLLRRRLLDDPSYRAEVDRRSADSDPSHWLKPEQFE